MLLLGTITTAQPHRTPTRPPGQHPHARTNDSTDTTPTQHDTTRHKSCLSSVFCLLADDCCVASDTMYSTAHRTTPAPTQQAQHIRQAQAVQVVARECQNICLALLLASSSSCSSFVLVCSCLGVLDHRVTNSSFSSRLLHTPYSILSRLLTLERDHHILDHSITNTHDTTRTRYTTKTRHDHNTLLA